MLEVNVASVNVNVYVLGFSLGGSNVAAVHVHVHVLGSMLSPNM